MLTFIRLTPFGFFSLISTPILHPVVFIQRHNHLSKPSIIVWLGFFSMHTFLSTGCGDKNGILGGRIWAKRWKKGRIETQTQDISLCPQAAGISLAANEVVPLFLFARKPTDNRMYHCLKDYLSSAPSLKQIEAKTDKALGGRGAAKNQPMDESSVKRKCLTSLFFFLFHFFNSFTCPSRSFLF